MQKQWMAEKEQAKENTEIWTGKEEQGADKMEN